VNDVTKCWWAGAAVALLALSGGCSKNGSTAVPDEPPLVAGQGERAALQAELEPNDSAAQANRVVATDTLFGDVNPGTDRTDQYVFRLKSSRTYRFSVSGQQGHQGLSVIDVQSGQRYDAGNGGVTVSLLGDRDYIIRVDTDDAGPAQQDYRVELFQQAGAARPDPECSPGHSCR
jgi:hypothetical protein